FAVKLDDNIAGLYSGFGRRACLGDFRDDGQIALISCKPESGNGSRRHVLRAHAKPAAHNPAVFAELFHYPARQVYRYGEPDADIAAGLAKDRAIDADHLSRSVDQ